MSDAIRHFRNPLEALAYQVECQLATLEELRLRKRVSQSDLRRHALIAETGVRACRDFCVSDTDTGRCSRVRHALGRED